MKKVVSNRHLLLHFILVFATETMAQNTYTGVVTGSDNIMLTGATVLIKGKTMAVSTAADGTFSITSSPGETLVISYVGYKDAELVLDQQLNIQVQLTPLLVNLNEVLVTGYTRQRIKDIAGSIASVKPRDLTSLPVGTTDNMLQGRVAGLTVITSGEPGAPANIRIHGIGNFGDVTPLYIIDGVQGNINSINPYDIESLQVLKDAAAFSIYGVRGANGVIVITTRRGLSGRPQVNYDMYLGYQFPLASPKLLNPQGNADLYWLASRNSNALVNGNPWSTFYGNGSDPVLPDYIFAGNNTQTLFDGDPRVDDDLYNINPDAGPIYQIMPFNKNGTDWYHEMYKPAFSQNHLVSMSGGGEHNQYFISLGYLDQQGTLINTYLQRFTARINTSFNFKKHFHFGENVQLSYSKNPKPLRFTPETGKDDLFEAIGTAPAQPVYDTHGAWNPMSNANDATYYNNPVARRELSKDYKYRNWELLGSLYAAVDFLKYFSFKTTFGGNISSNYNLQFQPASYDNVSRKNLLSESSGYADSWTWTNTMAYSQNWKNQSLKALAGTEYVQNTNRQFGASVSDLPFTNPDYWSLSNGAPGTQKSYGFSGISTLFSFFGRLEYNLLEKYYLTATVRRDGSSVFGPENRYGWFPAFGFAWRLKEEGFLKDKDWLEELKLRVSWGKTGYYGNTDPFNQYSLYGGNISNAYYDINGSNGGNIQRGFYKIRIGNPKTGWQQDVVLNFGADLILWKGKLSVTADWYSKESRGLLFPLSLPDYMGDVIPPNINIGTISNKGIDLAVGTKGSFNRRIQWDALLTFSVYDTKIERLNSLAYFDDAGGLVRNQVGSAISTFFGYQIAGIFSDSTDVRLSAVQPSAAPGRFKYLDWNGYDATGKLTGKPDGFITDADRKEIGNPNPNFTLGLNIGFRIGDFDVSTFFYGSFGNDVFYPLLNYREVSPINELNAFTERAYTNSWLPSRKNTNLAMAEIDYNFSNSGVNNSYAVFDATYIRNKSLIIGYTVPVVSLRKAGIERLRVYAQATNLFTITSYPGMDPEVYANGQSPLNTNSTRSAFGIDFGGYPTNQRQVLIGLNLNF